MSLFDDIREELGNPAIFEVSKRQFEQMTGEAVEDACGINHENYFYVKPGMSKKGRRNTYYHEFLDLLYPGKPHWWIALAAQVLARGGHRGEVTEGVENHDVSELPPRSRLVELARRASKRFNEKTTTRRKKSLS